MLSKVHSPERNHVGYSFAFWSIAQCHDKLQGQEKYIYQFKRQVNPVSLMQKVRGGYKLEKLRTIVRVPKAYTLAFSRRSMMMLNVSQRLAKANQEKMREKILYCKYQVLTESTKTKKDHVPGPANARRTCE